MSPEEWQAVALSARVATVATLLALPPAIAVGWWLARRNFPGRFLLDMLVQLPMVLPPVVPGYVLLLLFGAHGPFGSLLQRLGVQLAFNWKGAALAASVMGFPLMVQPIRLAFRMADRQLEQAARTLGATPWNCFLTISLPLATPGVIAGALLGFSRGLGEFGATMMFVGNIPGVTRTLPLAIYSYTHLPDGDAAAARLALLSVLLAACALLAAQALTRRAERWVAPQ